VIINYKEYEPKIGDKTWIADSADVIGDVEIGEDCSYGLER